MQNLMGVVASFIAVAIMLAIGTLILGSTGFDCTDLSGNATSGWQKECQDAQDEAVSGYALLIIVLIIIAAVAILAVVRML